MAVPTITNVTPTTGLSGGGTLVKIEGTNFRIYTSPSYGDPDVELPTTVTVSFNGVACDEADVAVYSATYLEAVTPTYTGYQEADQFTAVDIVVTNVDDDGNPIGGETVTAAAAFTYQREPLRPAETGPGVELHEGPFVRVGGEFLKNLRRQILKETAISTHTDYSENGATAKPAILPAINLADLDVDWDPYGHENAPTWVAQGDGSALRYPAVWMHAISFTLVGMSNNMVELLTLLGATIQYFRRNPYLVVTADIPEGSVLRMPIHLTQPPGMDRGIPNSNLRMFTGGFEVQRVPVLYLPADKRTWPIDTMKLEMQTLDGVLVETVNL